MVINVELPPTLGIHCPSEECGALLYPLRFQDSGYVHCGEVRLDDQGDVEYLEDPADLLEADPTFFCPECGVQLSLNTEQAEAVLKHNRPLAPKEEGDE